MTLLVISMVIALILLGGGIFFFRQARLQIVAEDSTAITVDKDGFIKRILPAGKHILQPFEKIDFTLDTKPKITMGQVSTVVTGDGIALNINWSGVYRADPELVVDKLNQRLRGLLKADRAIARQVDILLRKLVGDYTVQDLFKPAIRERIERQLSQLVAEQSKLLGIEVLGLNLQALDLPHEVAEALNKAKAMATLDGTIRQLDPATRQIVRGAYQLNEILHWDQYLPVPSRQMMSRLEGTNG